MKKKIICGILLGTMLSITAGCAGKDEYTDPDYSEYVESLGQYKGLTYDTIDTEPTQEDIDAELEEMLSYASYSVAVTDRAVQDGDTVNIDYVGYCDGGEIATTYDENGNPEGTNLSIGSGTYIDDFEEQLIGAEIGDEVTVEVTFPDDYRRDEHLAGKDAVFQVVINSISETQQPEELTDELVQELTDDYSTVEELTDAITEGLRASNEENAKDEYISDLMQQIVDGTTFNGYDQDTYDEFLESCKSTDEGYAEQFDYESLEDYVTDMYGYASLEEYEAALAEKCEFYTKKKMVIYEIAKAENIEISDTALSNYEDELVSKYGYTDKEALLEKRSEATIRYDFLAEQIYNFVYKNATAK